MEILEEGMITWPRGLKGLEMVEISAGCLWNCVQAAVSQGMLWALLPLIATGCHLKRCNRHTGISLIQWTISLIQWASGGGRTRGWGVVVKNVMILCICMFSSSLFTMLSWQTLPTWLYAFALGRLRDCLTGPADDPCALARHGKKDSLSPDFIRGWCLSRSGTSADVINYIW